MFGNLLHERCYAECIVQIKPILQTFRNQLVSELSEYEGCIVKINFIILYAWDTGLNIT